MNRKYLKWLLKIVFSAAALYIVFTQIDFNTLWQYRKANPLYLLLALVFFNASQVLSAFRHARLLETAEIYLNKSTKIGLYYLGMFYNLFLPGGIGGDGYKIYYLRTLHESPVRRLIIISLFDRGIGLVALLFMLWGVHLILPTPYSGWNFPVFLVLVGGLALLGLILHRFFDYLLPALPQSFMQSIGIQALQGFSAVSIALALGLSLTESMPYLALFYVSSIATVIPVTVGGLGIRELTLLWGCKLLNIPEEPAVAIGIIFFTITLISSLPGILVNLPKPASESPD